MIHVLHSLDYYTSGAMYSFPQIQLPQDFLAYCASINKPPDVQVDFLVSATLFIILTCIENLCMQQPIVLLGAPE